MKTLHYYDKPVEVHGIADYWEKGLLRRLPTEIAEKMQPTVIQWKLDKRCPGARICFKTDAREITFGITLETNGMDIGMSIFAAQSACVFFGRGEDSEFMGLVNPPNHNTNTFKNTFHNARGLTDVVMYFPRNEIIGDIWIEIPDDAVIQAPTPYRYSKPILFYGSSITEGGCCTKVSNAYNAIVCRWLDADFYNFGFSGNARGEEFFAEYLGKIPDVSVFVMDYDHNAPSVEHLRQTHEKFYKIYRKLNPMTPVVFMSRPGFKFFDDAAEYRKVILDTYNNAVKAGDKNLYFIDGEKFYGDRNQEICTVDRTHPNDYGMYRMAETVYPVLKEILEQK